MTFINNCDQQAIKALEYLANNPRPTSGNSEFNSEHLIQIAQELKKSLEEAKQNTNNNDDIYDIPIDLRLSGYKGELHEDGYIYCPLIPNSFTTKEQRIEFNKKYNKNLKK